MWLAGHINNLYNTTFWAMVQKGGMGATAAEEELKGTVAAEKNEIMFSMFGVNYNNEPEMFKKGSVVFRDYVVGKEVLDGRPKAMEGRPTETNDDAKISKTQAEKMRKTKSKAKVVVEHVDIIRDEFWEERPWILSGKPGRSLET